MPIMAALPAIGAAVSAGTSLYGALSGGTGSSASGANGTVPTGYQPTWQAGADQQYQNLIQSLYGSASSLPQQVTGPAQGYVNNIGANPYAGQSQDWAQALAGLGAGVSQGQSGASQNLYGMAGNAAAQAPGVLANAQGYAGQVMNTAFDPQNKLHDYMSQQTMDRTNAINAMNGVAGTPYGAGLAGDASRNYEMDWQNNLLNRQATGSQAYNGLMSTGLNGYNGLMGLSSNLYGQGSGLGTSAIGSLAGTGGVPYANYLQQQQDALGGLGSLSQLYTNSMAPSNSLLTSLQNYMNTGANATRTAQAGQANAFNQNQTQGSNLGQSLGSLGPALSGLSGIFGTPAAKSLPQTYSI